MSAFFLQNLYGGPPLNSRRIREQFLGAVAAVKRNFCHRLFRMFGKIGVFFRKDGGKPCNCPFGLRFYFSKRRKHRIPNLIPCISAVLIRGICNKWQSILLTIRLYVCTGDS